ncbi:hypothetical protein [Fodinicola feengrottensis]|uniref:hypothetical protein n=1 Tax=Fodinicola feengrottensis TaxID=435914 RepID=UPI0013D7C336|nr:hypothetical protein [Fodinicola feengrottensis]
MSQYDPQGGYNPYPQNPGGQPYGAPTPNSGVPYGSPPPSTGAPYGAPAPGDPYGAPAAPGTGAPYGTRRGWAAVRHAANGTAAETEARWRRHHPSSW